MPHTASASRHRPTTRCARVTSPSALPTVRVPSDDQHMDDPLDHIRRRFSRLYAPHIDVGRGWHQILITLDAELTTIDPDLRYIQIKEKFGGLRTYTTRPSPENWNRVRRAKRRAQDAALKTCEQCAAAGSMHSRLGWYRTLCGSCAAESEYVRVPDQRMSRAVSRLAKLDSLRVVDAEPTAEELILRAYVDRSDRWELVAALSRMEYTFPKCVEDGRKSGTWDQIPLAFYQRYLTAEELRAVRAAVSPPCE